MVGGGSAQVFAGGLDAKGCKGSQPNGFACFDFTQNIAANVSNLTFDITATSGVFDLAQGGPHLKILWLDAKGKKAGSLFSDDIPFSHATTPVSAVPEPATWAMMILGFGLAGSAVRRRRQVLAHA